MCTNVQMYLKVGVKSYRIMVLICIYLMTDSFGQAFFFPMELLDNSLFSLENYP